MLDLSKAFVSLVCQILLNKLRLYGCRYAELLWFKDFLSGRKQCVSLDDVTSTFLSVALGAAQKQHYWTPHFHHIHERLSEMLRGFQKLLYLYHLKP